MFEGGREGWLPIEIMLNGKWVTIISVYLWQRVKKGLDTRVKNSLMLEEMGEFIQSRLSAIDYIMIGGALGEEDIIEMMVEDREGVDIPSDHKLVWAHIAGRGIKCDEGRQGAHRVAWDKVTPEQWEGFCEILGMVWNKKVDIGTLVGWDKVEKVWEDYVRGLDSTRGLFRKERVGWRNTKENKQFRAGLLGKKQELKRRKQDQERAVCDRQERGNEEVMEKYESYIRIRDKVNRMRDKEWKKRKSEYMLRVLGDGRGVEARFWKVQEKEGRDYGVEKEGSGGGGGGGGGGSNVQDWNWMGVRATLAVAGSRSGHEGERMRWAGGGWGGCRGERGTGNEQVEWRGAWETRWWNWRVDWGFREGWKKRRCGGERGPIGWGN